MSKADTLESTHEHPVVEARDWRLGLIEMLAKLESLRQQLSGSRIANDADHILDRIEAMVLVTEEFSKILDLPDSGMDTQMNSMAKAGEFYAALNDVRQKTSRSLLKSVISKFSTIDERAVAALVTACVNAGLETLNAYFSLFTEMYQSSLKARGWVDAASAFLADFRQQIRAMQAGS